MVTHIHFPLFFTKTKKPLVWQGKMMSWIESGVSFDGTRKTINWFQGQNNLFFSTKPWRNAPIWEKNKVFPRRLSHLWFGAQSWKQPLLALTAQSFSRFSSPKRKRHCFDKGKMASWIESEVSFYEARKTITWFQVHNGLFSSTKPWRNASIWEKTKYFQDD